MPYAVPTRKKVSAPLWSKKNLQNSHISADHERANTEGTKTNGFDKDVLRFLKVRHQIALILPRASFNLTSLGYRSEPLHALISYDFLLISYEFLFISYDFLLISY